MVAFKDYFDRAAATELGKRVAASAQARGVSFDAAAFVKGATRGLTKLEFHDRVGLFAESLHAQLPESVPEALVVLVGAMEPPMEGTSDVTDGYLHWPMGEFIRRYGTAHFEASFNAMIELTQRFSSEFAVRPFVRDEPVRTLKRLQSLTDHPSAHVRRWCSEGIRPRLPWGEKLAALANDPSPMLPILDALIDDPVRYVTRSVANALGDIAKDHPERAVAIAGEWLERPLGAPVHGDARSDDARRQEREWIVRHGLRHPIKQGHPGALKLFGYGSPGKLALTLAIKPKRVKIGGSTQLTLQLKNKGRTKLRLLIDYRVHYIKKSGKPSPKVFKWTEVELAAGEERMLEKKQSLKPASTRALYPGEHVVDVQVNGRVFEGASFNLTR
ncbi:MAG: DNA alkylation repair protein [Myxococcota bacterium]